MSDAMRIPNIDYLGRCYDVVDTDPLNLGGSSKYENVVDIAVSEGRTVHTRDGSYVIPAGVLHKAIFSMSWESQSGVISSSYDFQEEFKQAIGAEAGVQGGFEFSASASQKEIVRRTESRKQSFVFSRAYQQNHGLQLELANDRAPLAVTEEFAKAVQQLPIDELPKVIGRYEDVVRRFGTHFTTEIILGGLAFQRTSGSSERFLRSKETENELKAQASVQIELIQAGANAEEARKKAETRDREYQLERTSLEFRGGDGSPSGIDSSWIASLHDRPAVVKANMQRLGNLLTSRFFPRDPDIEDRGCLLDLAISSWIVKHGQPSCATAPLRYGEAVVLTRPLYGGGFQVAVVLDKRIQVPMRGGKPLTDLGDVLALRLESANARPGKAAAVLAGDMVKLKLLQGNAYIGGRGAGQYTDLVVVNDVSQAATFAIMFAGDNLDGPGRLGEYLLESDPLVFMTGRIGTPERVWGKPASGDDFKLIDASGGKWAETTGSSLMLKRCDDSLA